MVHIQNYGPEYTDHRPLASVQKNLVHVFCIWTCNTVHIGHLYIQFVPPANLPKFSDDAYTRKTDMFAIQKCWALQYIYAIEITILRITPTMDWWVLLPYVQIDTHLHRALAYTIYDMGVSTFEMHWNWTVKRLQIHK